MKKAAAFLRNGAAMTVFMMAFTVVFLMPDQAHAYLNPGSNSTAVKWIIAGICAFSRMKGYTASAISRLFGK